MPALIFFTSSCPVRSAEILYPRTTFTVQLVFAFPDFAVIVAVPSFLPVTMPFLLTVATDLSDVLHVIADFSVTVALSVMLFPIATDAEVMFNVIPVSFFAAETFTDMVQIQISTAKNTAVIFLNPIKYLP